METKGTNRTSRMRTAATHRRWTGGVAAVALLACAAAAPSWAAELARRVPLRDIAKGVEAAESDETTRVRVTLRDEVGRRVEGARLEVRVKDDEATPESVAPGVFEFDLTRKGVRGAGVLEIRIPDRRDPVRARFELAAVPVVASDEGSLVRVGHGVVALHVRPGEEESARAVASFLAALRERLEAELAIDAVPTEIAFVPVAFDVRKVPESAVVVHGGHDAEAMRIEGLRVWVARSVASAASMRIDPKNRWVFEGLVDRTTTALLVDAGDASAARRSIAAGRDALERLRAGRTLPTWDLTDHRWESARGIVVEFGEPAGGRAVGDAGRAAAHAYWVKMASGVGEDLGARFLEAVSALEARARKQRRLVDVLEGLVGREIDLEIQSFLLPEAIAHLDGTVAPAGDPS